MRPGYGRVAHENKAKKQGLGLWQDKEPTSPREWRKRPTSHKSL